jgi:hypothetical protein
MKEATHFMEIWKDWLTGKTRCIGPFNISRLSEALESSRRNRHETIAIWKIYPKNKVTILKQERREIDPTNIITL